MADSLQQKIENLNRSIKEAVQNISKLKEEVRAANDAQSGSLTPVLEQQEKLNKLLIERNKLLKEIKSNSGSKTSTTVSGGDPDSDVNKTKASTISSAEVQAAINNLGKEKVATESATEARRKAAEAHRREAQELARTNIVYKEAVLQAEKLGLSISNLQKIEDRGGGVERLNFRGQKGGRDFNYSTFVNKDSGKATPGLSSQFRSFGSDIVRDIGQFTKWSIAVAAVYTPMQKLGELMQTMIENESRLADAAIAANQPFEKAGEIFDTVYTAASKAGEGVTGVIDAYAQAVRAAGRYTDEQVKQQKAAALLNDSLILSKLSTLDQSGAIDTLTAALIQSGLELDKGQALLNKWVKVSQVANVDIATLATGVAVLGDAAETAGLGVDQLNGLVAVLAEQSISGSKEAANTAKALIGAYQSDTAEKTLTKFGISLRNTNGEVRDFLEVYKQLADLRSKGILSEQDISELSLALGQGGTRRAKDVSALINALAGGDASRYNKIVQESASVTDESTLAQDSLAKKLETVQTATTNAGNAFQSLAQTLGDEGGLLDIFKGFLDLTGLLTNGLDKLFESLGRSGPALVTFGAGLAALNGLSSERRQSMIASLGGTFYKGGTFLPGGGRAPAGGTNVGGNQLLSNILQMNYKGAGTLGGAAVIAAGVQNLQAGKNEQAIGNVVGGAIGAAIGTALGGPIGLAAGATIGSSVGDAFVTGVLSHSDELKDLFAGLAKPEGGTTGTGIEQPKEVSTAELIKEVYKKIGGGNEFLGGLNAKRRFGSAQAFNFGGDVYATPESAALSLLKERKDKESQELYARLQARFDAQNKAQGNLDVTSTPGDIMANQRRVASLQTLAESERKNQLANLAQGKITSSQYGRISEGLGGFPSSAIQQVDSFGQAFIEVSKDVNSVSDAYKALLELTVNGTDDQKAQLAAYVNDIQKLQSEWEHWTPGTKDLTLELSTGKQTYKGKEDLTKAISEKQLEAAQFTNYSITQSRLQKINLPGVVGSYTEATKSKDVNAIVEEGQRIQQQYYQDVGASADEIEHLVKNIEAFAVYTEDGGKKFYETIEGLNQWAYDAAKKSLEEMGKIAAQNAGFGLQKFDVDRGTLEKLAAQSVTMGQQWAQQYPGFETKPEDVLAITNDGLAKPIHADFKILALLLEKIVDQNQKQLDGQYNIPEGATFWVPLTAAYYRNKGGDSGSLSSALDALSVDENTGATNQNTDALNTLRDAITAKKEEQVEKAYGGLRGKDTENTLGATTKKTKEASTNYYDRLEELRLERGKVSTELPGGTPTFQNGQLAALLTEIKNAFTTAITSAFGKREPAYGGSFDPSVQQKGLGSVGGRDMNTAPASRLDIRIQSTSNLMIDSRVVATAIQDHFASDLIKTEASAGTITKRYVV